jgi:hypothetical protein
MHPVAVFPLGIHILHLNYVEFRRVMFSLPQMLNMFVADETPEVDILLLLFMYMRL